MASTGTNIFKLKSFCVVTGASQGLGQCIAIQFGKKLPRDSVVVLIARNAEKLEQTKKTIENSRSGVDVIVNPMDLGCQNENKFDEMFARILRETKKQAADFEQAIVVHNAASLGPVDKHFTAIDSWNDVSKYFDLNVASVVSMNSVFLRQFSSTDVKQRVVINISSICSLQPFKSWSLYCAGKAARDMLFRTMALEEPEIRILNYAPGPVDTDMQVIARSKTADKELKQMFADMHIRKKLLTVDESIAKLVTLLENNTFDTGAHIDYYDL